MTKGSQVAISGRITTRSYDAKDGTKRYVTEVVADMINGVQFLSKGKVNEMNQDPGNTFDSMGFDDITLDDSMILEIINRFIVFKIINYINKNSISIIHYFCLP